MKIIILSCKEDNIIPCVENIFVREPKLPRENIIVVDDGAGTDHAKQRLRGITWVQGVKPFVFARNANIGICAADDDVILMNDDVEVCTDNGLSNLLRYIGNALVFPAFTGRFTGDLAFACVLIPKHTQQTIGLLDERFVLYGYEDDDYARRVWEADLPIYKCRPDVCSINHLPPERSSFHGPNGTYTGDNMVVFDRKWGINRKYTWPEHLAQLTDEEKLRN